ncbi:Serine/threonine-protein kinase SRK2A, partial [Zea mays]
GRASKRPPPQASNPPLPRFPSPSSSSPFQSPPQRSFQSRPNPNGRPARSSRQLPRPSPPRTRPRSHGEVRAAEGHRRRQLRRGAAHAEQGDQGAGRHEVHPPGPKDRRECGEGDHQPPLAAPPQHHPVQGGGADADAPGDRDGVRRRRRAVRPDLQRREVQRGRGEVLLPAADLWRQLLPLHANLPPRLEAGEHAAGRQPGASPQDLRLRLLQVAVVAAALEAQVDGRHAGVHRPRGALPPGIRRQGQSRALASKLPPRQILSSLSLPPLRRGKVGPPLSQ